jgi:hypothetical protein
MASRNKLFTTVVEAEREPMPVEEEGKFIASRIIHFLIRHSYRCFRRKREEEETKTREIGQ